MSDLYLALSKLVKDNLPEVTALEMSKYLQSAKAAIEENARYKTSNENLSNQITSLTGKLLDANKKIDDLKEKEKFIIDKEQQLHNKEIDLIRKEAFITAEIANASKNATLDVVNSFLRNPTVRTSVQQTVGVAVLGKPSSQYSDGTAGFVQQSYDSKDVVMEHC